MKATLTSKGQITIPLAIRERLRLKTGDVLDFDEKGPLLKARRVVDRAAWKEALKTARAALRSETKGHPWEKKSSREILNDLRGPVDLPSARSKKNK